MKLALRMILEFESDFISCDDNTDKHHEQRPAFQRRFESDVRRLADVFDDDNPFIFTSESDLMVLGRRTVTTVPHVFVQTCI